MSREDRLAFLQKFGSDPLTASALLCAPSYLSELTDAETDLIRARIEKGAIPVEVREARASTLKMLAAVERGWQRAAALINERAGLRPEPVNLTAVAKAKTEAAA